MLKNGSGLNDTNRFTARQIATLLQAVWKRFPVASEFVSSLGIAARDGTMRLRMEGTDAAGRLRAKTGTLERVTAINGRPPDEIRPRLDFNRLGAIHPNEQLRLECGLLRQGQPDFTNRVIDILCPFGKGQRALIVAPAKAGKTMVLESIAQGDDWSAKTIVTIVWEACSVLAVLLAVTAVAENKDSRFSRIRSILIIAIALLYALMAGASAGAVSLALGLIGIDAIRHGGLRTKTMVVGLTVALVCFAAIATVQSKGNVDSHASLSENVFGTVELVGVYLLGGVVAFDAVVQYPASITPVWSIWRVFQLTANKFGASFDVPSVHAQYTDISDDYNGNVYTIYFSYYPDYGLAGVCAIMLVLGAVVTVIYQKAIQGNPRSVLLYAFVFSGIVLSGFSEYFFLGANFWFKAVLYTMLAYRFVPNPAESNVVTGNAVLPPLRYVQRVMG